MDLQPVFREHTINELTLYTNHATATDADVPAQTLTFGLVSGPGGLTVSSRSSFTRSM